jgi:hypothetical protein
VLAASVPEIDAENQAAVLFAGTVICAVAESLSWGRFWPASSV